MRRTTVLYICLGENNGNKQNKKILVVVKLNTHITSPSIIFFGRVFHYKCVVHLHDISYYNAYPIVSYMD